MANNYLDYDGLALYDEKIKQVIGGKVDKDGSKVLSTNDYTTAEKNKLAGIATGATANAASTTTPKMDGTAAVGTDEAYARADHVHPTDSSRAAAADLANYLPLAGGTMENGARIGFPSGGSLNFGLNGIAQVQLTNNGNNSSSKITANKSIVLDAPSITLGPAIGGTYNVTAPTPTAGDNSGKVATTKFVSTAIANAISSIQGISYEVVQTLPTTGAAGVIYLISNSGSGQNIYDEYIWTGSAFEKIGTTDVDLSGYQPKMDAITNAQINSLFT